MSETATKDAGGPGLKTVVGASAAGTAFEWYDFFIFGSLTTIIARHFYADVGEATSYILALLTFGVGFVVRPLGALVFGWFGDKTGRKTTFLVTISLMGVATVAIGLLPDYGQIGIIAPILLLTLRVLQGFALGGEYGGAAIYVAEHAPAKKRGFLTGWIQTTAAIGLIMALSVILITRVILGVEAFDEWGWRIPFLLSSLLLIISLWIRLKLHESPAFKRMVAESTERQAPFRESFGTWKVGKFVLIALVGIMFAQGAVWYAGYFYTRFFMERVLKVDVGTVDGLILAITLASAFLYVFFGWLSDRVGRKPVMVGGMVLFLLAVFPGFHALTNAANPALAQAQASSPVTVIADPATCAVQFDPVGKTAFASSCDLAKSVLSNAGVSYDNLAAAPGSVASVRIGTVEVASVDGTGLEAAALKTARTDVETRVKAALTAAGYPATADPAGINLIAVFGILMVFMVAATAVYGPQAAALVELFPTRVRYTAMSLPYNVGTGWVGGLLPAASFALVAWSGNIYFGLWYSVAFTAVAAVVALIFLPETRGRDLNTIGD
ncbi:MFS transporter [Brevundimonas subvibrioides]|uniref:Transporter n=1 Tax=Brevundimonas subvibrioides (strain ATCC 15264 / DSM 4735 / LMG 14903 / NBRC 16000 / CB 81) TaxID=633149 RepID=D9QIH8_BRESC|nr:MFS transporter [Brevundimonas subvibrioides]ADK99480.1 transporter [Brevundimonas subvibrioides ATCC 15264]